MQKTFPKFDKKELSEYNRLFHFFWKIMTDISVLIKKNSEMLVQYTYAYISSTALFLGIKKFENIPHDLDIALDWTGKGSEELFALYHHIQAQPGIKKLKIQMIENTRGKTEALRMKTKIQKANIAYLLKTGNLKLTYTIDNLLVEIFPEQEGNGITNIGLLGNQIKYTTIEGLKIPYLDSLSVAKGYVFNLIDEMTGKHHITLRTSRCKTSDAIRLHHIIMILHYHELPCEFKDVLAFIRKTIIFFEHVVPMDKRSPFVQRLLGYSSKIVHKLQRIGLEYQRLAPQQQKGGMMSIYDFHRLLQKEICQVYKTIVLYQDEIYQNFAKKKTVPMTKLKQFQCQKIDNYLQKVSFTSMIDGFAYFYEIYTLKEMIKKI